jgi:hypothetical protein
MYTRSIEINNKIYVKKFNKAGAIIYDLLYIIANMMLLIAAFGGTIALIAMLYILYS